MHVGQWNGQATMSMELGGTSLMARGRQSKMCPYLARQEGQAGWGGRGDNGRAVGVTDWEMVRQ